MEKHKERTHNNGGVKTECNVKKKKKIYNTSMKKCFLDSNLLFMCLFEKKKKSMKAKFLRKLMRDFKKIIAHSVNLSRIRCLTSI